MSSSIPQTSGIYKITCIPNSKVYVGSAVNLAKRYREHWSALRSTRHRNRRLQNAWDKYGEAGFVFEVIELVLVSFLLEREQFWIDKLDSAGRKKGLNLSPTAGSALGVKYSDEARQKISDGRRGLKFTDEARAGRSRSQTNNWQAPSYRRKLEDAHSNRWLVIDPAGNETVVFNLKRFCRDNGLTNSCMAFTATRDGLSHKGWRCRKLDRDG